MSMDFRKTYAGPGRFDGRAGNDPFSQLSRDTRQERDDRARYESGGGKGASRPTQSSLAKGSADSRVLRNSFSARSSGRYNPLSQSVDLGPNLQRTSQGGSNIPRQPVMPQHQPGPSTGLQPGPVAPAAAAHAAREKLQDLIESGQHREALLIEQKRQLEATLHSANMRFAEVTRSLQQANAALESERAAAARLRSERDEHAAELDRARSQAAELQASGNIALTTSEVCRAALSTAFKGTVSAIGSAHEELESALANQEQQGKELEARMAQIAELEEAVAVRERDLEDARSAKWKISEEMEDLAGRLQASEDNLNALVMLLVPGAPGASSPSYRAAVGRARELQERVQQLEQQLEGQGVDLAQLRSRLAEYQAQMSRVEERLRSGSSGQSSPDGAGRPGDLEAQVSELAAEREQLEGDNLTLAAENEQLRRDNAGLRERLEEALVAAAIVTASSDRDAAAGSEIARLHQEVSKATAQAEDWRQRAEAARALADEANNHAVEFHRRLQEAAVQAEAIGAQLNAARAELEAGRVEETRAEVKALRERAEAVQDELECVRAEAERACIELAAAHDSTRRELEAAREEAETWRAQADAAERAHVEEGERAQALEARAVAHASKVQELSVEAAHLRLKVCELQDQLAADRRETQEARDQLAAMHANENALMQRILAAEVERQQLLRQIDTSNSVMAELRKRLDEAMPQVAELSDLRSRAAALSAEAEQHAKAAAAASARVAPLEVELQDLRDMLRSTTERASHEARLHERREQQLAALRQQSMEAEAQQLQAEKEISLLRAQVGVNDSLRACVDELQVRLARATLRKPCVDSFPQVSGGGTAPVPQDHLVPGAFLSLHPAACHDEALLAAHVARQSMVAGWLGTGASNGGSGGGSSGGGALAAYGIDARVISGSLLDSYNAIPEDETEDDKARWRGQRHQPHGRRMRPIRFLFGLVIKGTLVAGGMAVGLALGNPKGFEALRAAGTRTGGAGRAQPSQQVVVVEGMALPPH